MKKKNNFFFFTDFNSLEATLNAHNFLIRKLEQNFDELIFIDISNFILFSSKKRKSINHVKKKFKKTRFINFKNSDQFNSFFKDQKNSIGINNFGKKFKDIYIHYLMKQNDIKQIMVLNIDIISYTRKIENRFFFKKITSYIDNKVSSYFINILTFLNVLNKIEICFTTKTNLLKNFENTNKFKKKFLFYKKVILVNSVAYDEVKSKKLKTANKNILFIDYNINHGDNVKIGKKMNKKIIRNHYEQLNFLLKKISQLYKKKIVVSIHPLYSIKETKRFFNNYKVIKNKTLDLIRKAEIIILFNSTVINFAYLLNKKILFLKTQKIGKGPEKEFNTFPEKSGCPQIDIHSADNLTKHELELQFKKNILKKKNFIEKYLIPDGAHIGSDKLIHVIKKNFY